METSFDPLIIQPNVGCHISLTKLMSLFRTSIRIDNSPPGDRKRQGGGAVLSSTLAVKMIGIDGYRAMFERVHCLHEWSTPISREKHTIKASGLNK